MANLDNEKIGAGDPLRIVIVGGGLCGLLTGMLLADDGHEVVVLERDPAEPPAEPADAWLDWERRSIRQFHMGHFFLPRFRAELDAHLPRVRDAMTAAGAISVNPISTIPAELTGGWRDGDERFEAVTGRRPVIEAAVAACAAATTGLTVRRGVAVERLVTTPIRTADGAPTVHVVGVETSGGESITADLVVDTTGRNSGLPRLVTAAGGTAPRDEADDSGFVYYGRTFGSDDGSIPPAFGGGLQAYGSISTLTLAADNGTWQIAFVASGRDAVMRRARHEEAFEKLWRSYPLVAHWLDGEPLSDIEVMANLEDRLRHFVVDGVPVATGLAAVGDSWACTNPSVGRGASMALLHAVALRRQLQEEPIDDPVAWSLSWDRRTARTVEPFYRETVRADRHRLAQIEAAIDGRDYVTDDPTHAFGEALPAAAMQDPTALRAWLDTFMLHRLVDDVMSDEGFVQRVLELGADREPAPGLTRAELEAVLA